MVSGYQVSALPLATGAASLIEKETDEVSCEKLETQKLNPET